MRVGRLLLVLGLWLVADGVLSILYSSAQDTLSNSGRIVRIVIGITLAVLSDNPQLGKLRV